MLFFKNITWANKRIVPEHECQSRDFKKKKKTSHQTYLPTWPYFYYSSRGDFSLSVSIHHFSPLCGRTSVDPRASCSPSALVPSSWPFLCLEFMPEHSIVNRVLLLGVHGWTWSWLFCPICLTWRGTRGLCWPGQAAILAHVNSFPAGLPSMRLEFNFICLF